MMLHAAISEGMKYMPNGPQYHLHRTVVLVGMMGSGKTAIGRALSAKLAVPFVDSDAAIEEAAALSIAEIFNRDGEAFFRKRETEVLCRLLAGPPSIVSTGGGAYLSGENRDAIAQLGVALWLNADLGTLWERVRHKDTRPLLRTADPKATLTTLLAERTSFYEKAELQVAIDRSASIDDTTGSVIEILLSQSDILEIAT